MYIDKCNLPTVTKDMLQIVVSNYIICQGPTVIGFNCCGDPAICY